MGRSVVGRDVPLLISRFFRSLFFTVRHTTHCMAGFQDGMLIYMDSNRVSVRDGCRFTPCTEIQLVLRPKTEYV